MTTYQYLRVDRRGGVTYVTLNRPDKLNAVTMEMSREILSCIRSLSDDDASRVIVLTGAGRAFCAGGDLSLEDSFTQHGFRRELELYTDTVLALLSCTKPIICEMNGDAVGWGATIALFCDIIIAHPGARIGDPHVNVGLSTGDGASVIWPQLAGYPRAKQFLLTGELMTAGSALTFGLVNEVVEGGRLRARVDEIADKIASKPALAVAMTKASINIPLKELVRTSTDTYIAYEMATQQHPDHPAAVKKFLERRANKTVTSGSNNMSGRHSSNGLWVEESGSGGDVLLLIHGLGANGAVWDPFRTTLAREWEGRVIVPDLRGHGRSKAAENYSFGTFTADIADLLSPGDKVSVIGHSLGGALGALLGCGWFGFDIDFVLALSVKMKWSLEEILKGRSIAQNPVKWLPGRAEALDRYLKVSGLANINVDVSRSAEAGICGEADRYRITADPKIFGSASLGVDTIMRAVRCGLVLATGANDPIAPVEDIRSAGFEARVIEDAGHNVHVTSPERVWQLFSDARSRRPPGVG